MNWVGYTEDEGNDPGIILFDYAVQSWGLTFQPDDRILEIGSHESDWMERILVAEPTLRITGVDPRDDRRAGGNVEIIRGDIITIDFPPNYFDAVVSIGAIEHIGLGHYNDPIDPDGDIKAVKNAFRWLKPGGLFYFDVPFNTSYTVRKEWRGYDIEHLKDRLIPDCWIEKFRAYSLKEPEARTIIDEPTTPHEERYYVLLWLQKPL